MVSDKHRSDTALLRPSASGIERGAGRWTNRVLEHAVGSFRTPAKPNTPLTAPERPDSRCLTTSTAGVPPTIHSRLIPPKPLHDPRRWDVQALRVDALATRWRVLAAARSTRRSITPVLPQVRVSRRFDDTRVSGDIQHPPSDTRILPLRFPPTHADGPRDGPQGCRRVSGGAGERDEYSRSVRRGGGLYSDHSRHSAH